MKVWVQGNKRGLRKLRKMLKQAIKNGQSELPDPGLAIFVLRKQPHTGADFIMAIEFEPGAEGEWRGYFDNEPEHDWRWDENGQPLVKRG